MHTLKLGTNEDIRSRITYSVNLNRLNPDNVKAFRVGGRSFVRHRNGELLSLWAA